MKVITEMVLRNELKGECPPIYYVPKDKLLSPAAKEYLNQLKIKVEFGDPPAAPAPAASSNNKASAISDTPAGTKNIAIFPNKKSATSFIVSSFIILN